jgi:hypothetical protein
MCVQYNAYTIRLSISLSLSLSLSLSNKISRLTNPKELIKRNAD